LKVGFFDLEFDVNLKKLKDDNDLILLFTEMYKKLDQFYIVKKLDDKGIHIVRRPCRRGFLRARP
jgi:hypothetical protein